jgi:hypothetical protein
MTLIGLFPMNNLRKSLVFLMVLLATSTLMSTTKPTGKKVTVHGYLVDIACVLERMSESEHLGQIHTKKCLQMPACERSGYAVMDSQNNVYKFDASGNEIAKKLISATDKDKDWRIVVSGKLLGDQLTVAKLQIQK